MAVIKENRNSERKQRITAHGLLVSNSDEGWRTCHQPIKKRHRMIAFGGVSEVRLPSWAAMNRAYFASPLSR